MTGGGDTADALIEAAMERTGLDHLGSAHHERYLNAWCADLRSGRLSAAGRDGLAKQAQRQLELRLRVLYLLRTHPEIAQVRLPPIVRIMGFPRSGTTFLHNLLSLHPPARSLRRWELVRPLPPPEAATHATDPRIAEVQRSLESLRGTAIERLHWVEADDPEECTWGFLDLSGLVGRGVVGVMQEWADAVVDPGRAHRETYEEYLRLVQLLLWRNPMPDDGVLVLKCPTDNDQIQTFLEVFDEAKVVLCHRDPFRTVTSSCRTQEVVHGPYLAQPHAARVGAANERVLELHRRFATGMMRAAGQSPERIVSVHYRGLMDDPAAIATRALREAAAEVDADQMEQAVTRFIDDQRSGRRATPPAAYDAYGHTADAVRSDPVMAEYIETFGVPTEDVRVSAPNA